ncbi:helix-turn-helix transcriptional regulator [Streptomyces diacarni]|uniref:XRE family transcriptional regulator n=1 Tax=Streptomyces diacarni TaxID=2800381 RepID=A0A367F9V2_9ACTN|nr:helix-turn-helix transcriptional regulator [Streptomyces diacarni]RCG27134.1 XRE family transcriptional regulator [Streptomyces diacarni]
MDRAQLADFLRVRREALQPEDVGLPRGPRRRTRGLRREEAAALSGMSTDYYGRLEQQRGPQPSPAMLAAMARGLRLSLAERDHLFRIAGHNAPPRTGSDHLAPGLMRILDRLGDTPAQVVTDLAETLWQTPLAAALVGDEMRLTGPNRSLLRRWFTDPAARLLYPEEDHPRHSRFFTAELRGAYSRQGRGSRAEALVEELLGTSEEFARWWSAHEVSAPRVDPKRFCHPELGVLELQCQVLLDPEQAQALLVYTATPGTESDEKLRLLPATASRPAGAAPAADAIRPADA